jgi:YT521-B-like domain
MISAIDAVVCSSDKAPARVAPLSAPQTETSIVIPTPATEHAPKGYINDDSARGTIWWEADKEENTDTKDPEDTANTTETEDLDTEQQTFGHPFKIEWVSTEKVPFHRARGLRNPWNHNREVKIARDGTEIEPSVGRRLVNLFHRSPITSASPGGPQVSYSPGGFPPMPPQAYPPNQMFGRPY